MKGNDWSLETKILLPLMLKFVQRHFITSRHAVLYPEKCEKDSVMNEAFSTLSCCVLTSVTVPQATCKCQHPP